MNDQEIIKKAMSILGSRTSEKKAAASRLNGLKGGKPKHLNGGRKKGSSNKVKV